MYYFGVWHTERTGHYLYDKHGRRYLEHTVPYDFPINYRTLDGGLLPPRLREEEGRAIKLWVLNWTIVSFWDRSADKRPGACSSFIARGQVSCGDLIQYARANFPNIMERIKFPITELTSIETNGIQTNKC